MMHYSNEDSRERIINNDNGDSTKNKMDLSRII